MTRKCNVIKELKLQFLQTEISDHDNEITERLGVGAAKCVVPRVPELFGSRPRWGGGAGKMVNSGGLALPVIRDLSSPLETKGAFSATSSTIER